MIFEFEVTKAEFGFEILILKLNSCFKCFITLWLGCSKKLAGNLQIAIWIGCSQVRTNQIDEERHKSRIKRDNYNPYSTDEERLANRPEQVSLSDWKIILKYWGDEKVQKVARKNSESRKKITETHTIGSTSFAQVAHKMRLEKLAKLEKEKQEKLEKMSVNGEGEGEVNGEGGGEEDPIIVSDADIYLATRKRDKNHEYKLPEQVDVKKTLETQGVEAANKLVRGDKAHTPSYLIGRLIRKKEPKLNASTYSGTSSVAVLDQFVSELTAKIIAQLQQEMDQKLEQKMREMMKMLAAKNLDLKLDTADDSVYSVQSEKSAEVSQEDDHNDASAD
ncbi:hypothetical protein OROMI_018767 [Orobanche minor]